MFVFLMFVCVVTVFELVGVSVVIFCAILTSSCCITVPIEPPALLTLHISFPFEAYAAPLTPWIAPQMILIFNELSSIYHTGYALKSQE
jgi:hypothetical protein